MSDIQHAMQLSRARSTGQMVGDAGAMAARHQVFYAAVQAVMYTMCYHMRVLLGGEERGRVMAVVQQLKEVCVGGWGVGRTPWWVVHTHVCCVGCIDFVVDAIECPHVVSHILHHHHHVQCSGVAITPGTPAFLC